MKYDREGTETKPSSERSRTTADYDNFRELILAGIYAEMEVGIDGKGYMEFATGNQSGRVL